MKIYEVVSENNDLKEGVGSWIMKLASKIPGIGKLASKVTASLTRNDAIENLARMWAKEISSNPNREIITRDPAIIKDMLRDELKGDVAIIMVKAEAKAPSYASNMALRNLGTTVASKTAKAASMFADSAKDTYKFAMTIGVAGPFYTYWQNTSALDKQLEAGQITEEEYTNKLRIQRGMLLASVTAGMVGNAAIKTLAWLPSKIPVIKSIVPLATGIANIEVANFINSEKGRYAIAQLLTSQFINLGGSVVDQAVNTLKSGIGQAKQAVSPDQGQGALASEPETPSVDTTKKQPSTKSTAEPSSDQGTWVDLTSRIQQNTATGATRIKPF